MVKNLPASAGHTRDMGSIPGWRRSRGEGNGNALQYSCLENPMDRGAWRLQSMGSQRVGRDGAMSADSGDQSQAAGQAMPLREVRPPLSSTWAPTALPSLDLDPACSTGDTPPGPHQTVTLQQVGFPKCARRKAPMGRTSLRLAAAQPPPLGLAVSPGLLGCAETGLPGS